MSDYREHIDLEKDLPGGAGTPERQPQDPTDLAHEANRLAVACGRKVEDNNAFARLTRRFLADPVREKLQHPRVMDQIMGFIGTSVFFTTLHLEWWYSMPIYTAIMGEEWGYMLFGLLTLSTLYASLCLGEQFPDYSLRDSRVKTEPADYERKLFNLRARRSGQKQVSTGSQMVQPRYGFVVLALVQLIIFYFSYQRVYLQMKIAGSVPGPMSQWPWHDTLDLFMPGLFYLVEAGSGILAMYEIIGVICRMDVGRKKKEASALLQKRDEYSAASLEYWDTYRNQGFPAYATWAEANGLHSVVFTPPNPYLRIILKEAGRPESDYQPAHGSPDEPHRPESEPPAAATPEPAPGPAPQPQPASDAVQPSFDSDLDQLDISSDGTVSPQNLAQQDGNIEQQNFAF